MAMLWLCALLQYGGVVNMPNMFTGEKYANVCSIYGCYNGKRGAEVMQH